MSAKVVYVDSSAFMKMVVEEAESSALRHHLRDRPLMVAASLLRTEVIRASMRVSGSHVAHARRLLPDVALIDIDRPLLQHAGELAPAAMRSLDAIHIAAALLLADDVKEFLTYDLRMADAARDYGLVVTSPN
jgi:uncharacterized protein